jgi:hypothetical protein
MMCAPATGVLSLLASTIAVGRVAGQQLAVSSPVERVVTLLKDLQEKPTLDERAEQKLYDKYACWCKDATERKASDINKAQEELRALGQRILSSNGKIATLTSEM